MESNESELETLKKQVTELEKQLEKAQRSQSKLEKKLKQSERTIEITERYNESLRGEVNTLRKQVHGYKHKQLVDASIQTDFVVQHENTQENNKEDLNNLQGDGLSIAESLKAAAEAATTQSGFVYDERTGLYYDYSTGYYYDQKNQLYYEPNTGIYYYYDQKMNTYHFHSQVDITQTAYAELSTTDVKEKKKKKKSKEKKKMKSNEDGNETEIIEIVDDRIHKSNHQDQAKSSLDIEVIEIDDSDDDSCHGDKMETSNPSCIRDVEFAKSPDKSDSEMEEGEISDSSDDGEDAPMQEDEMDSSSSESEEENVVKEVYAPCVRLIVTDSDSLDLGTLFIVTCTGGTIGRDEKHCIAIPDLSVSKLHAEIGYSKEDTKYWIKDCGSQNGTFLNDTSLTDEARQESDYNMLSHDDILKVAMTTLLVHIHPGDDTCDKCEPGVVQAQIAKQQPKVNAFTIVSKEEKEKLRRRQLKQIKQKYMLANTDYEEKVVVNENGDYVDRAEERRKTVGSDNPYQKDDMPASVHRAIDDRNVGHKMMKKMGWSEGHSLGKNDEGIHEPIQVLVRDSKAGLGSGIQRSMDDVQYSGRNVHNWSKARGRFQGSSQSAKLKSVQPQWIKGDTVTIGERQDVSDTPIMSDNATEQSKPTVDLTSKVKEQHENVVPKSEKIFEI
ncbi:angiogenic factor with G patch and FHA domains 1-like [Saccoglossus kowalevskii]|uniref:Angiogenic factor with G patch and FHA domains 1-like n=1 Tax=Saccoglossus kowalevskii TaxID=10224 RepID=A0ABM0GLT2_SACKO|nr:PREDICTED: angiogenic factor with G patch and FHA domains 1-like [Saccoglossus kowalevskii]